MGTTKPGVEPRSFLLGAGMASLVAVFAFILAQDAIKASLGGPGCSLRPSLQPPAPSSRYLIDPYPVNGPIRWPSLSPATRAAFDLGGRVRVIEWYPPYASETVSPHWTEQLVEKMVKLAKAGQTNVGNQLSTYGPYTNQIFHEALRAFSVAGKSVLVLGSRAPWVEAFCIAYGAASITTVDFNKPTTDDPRLTTISIPELDATNELFDILISYSSLEHDGLGRYGDPINPNGDLERMRKVKGLVKPGGLFFLGVPNAQDALVFFAHRVYGPVRFPLLIEGWTLLRTFGTPLEQLYTQSPVDRWEQPLHVLSLKAKPCYWHPENALYALGVPTVAGKPLLKMRKGAVYQESEKPYWR